MRRMRYYIDINIDLSRALEIISEWVPELFLAVGQIHANRMLAYINFVYKSMLRMQLDVLFSEFCAKLPSKARNLNQFFMPFVGIAANLQIASNFLAASSECSGTDTFEQN